MIVKNNAQIRQHIPVNITLDINNLKPFIAAAESKYLVQVLGIDQYNALDTFAASSEPDAKLQLLLDKCIAPVIMLALHDGFDLLNVEFSDAGWRRSESENKKGLYGYQERNIKNYLKTSGYNGLDLILAFLEENIEDYQLWADSEECSLANDGLIVNAREFSNIYSPLKNSSVVFRNMKSAMQRVEDFKIRTAIGDDIVDKVKELVLDREIDEPTNAKYKKLLGVIQKPFAYLSIEESATELGAKFTDMGLLFEEVNAGLIPDNVSSTADSAKVEKIIKQAHDTGSKYLSLLISFLNENTTDYPEYTAIELVSEPEDQTSKKFVRAY